jgi:hypothetical protein
MDREGPYRPVSVVSVRYGPYQATREFNLPVWPGVVAWTVALYSDVFSESVRVQYYRCQPFFLFKYVSQMGVVASTSVIMPMKLPKMSNRLTPLILLAL